MLRGRVVLACAIAIFGATDCSEDKSYVHVYVTGADQRLSIQPFELQVSAFAQGKRSQLDYTTQLHKAEGPANEPFTDFLLDVAPEAASGLDLRVVTRGVADNVEWGGDVHLVNPSTDVPVLVSLSRGEARPFPDDVFNLLGGDMQNATLFGGSFVALAWVDHNGIREVQFDPDRPVGRGQVVCDPTACTDVQVLRIASRPLSSFGSDLYAIAWIQDGHVKLKTTTRTEKENPIIDIAPQAGAAITDLEIAAFPNKSSKADIVVARLEGSDVVTSFHDVFGAPIGNPSVGVTGAQERSIVGLVTTLDGSFIVGVHGAAARVVRLGPDSHLDVAAGVDGDLRAIGLGPDGSRVFVASSVGSAASTARLDFTTYSTRELARVGDQQLLTDRAFPPGTSFAGIAASSCGVAWSEAREDGTDDVDIRVQRIDENGALSGPPFFANVATSGTWTVPSLVCVSKSRVFATFFDRAADQTGNLYLRRLP
jgi:hypothetical protein